MCSQDDDPSQHDDVLRTANYAPGFVPTRKIDALIAERDELHESLRKLSRLWNATETREAALREALTEIATTGSGATWFEQRARAALAATPGEGR